MNKIAAYQIALTEKVALDPVTGMTAAGIAAVPLALYAGSKMTGKKKQPGISKVAAYACALEQLEQEKRASYLTDRYGTCEGALPEPYMRAFDAMDKEAGLQAIGQSITKGVYGLGKALGGTGKSGQRTGLGGKMMDWASGVGGDAASGAAKARLATVSKMDPNLSPQQLEQIRTSGQKVVGGVGTAAALGTAGAAGAALS